MFVARHISGVAVLAASFALFSSLPVTATGQSLEIVGSGGVCQEPDNQSREIALRQDLPVLVEWSAHDGGIPVSLLRPSEADVTEAGSSPGVSLSEDVHAVVRYRRARVFDTMSSDDLRRGQHGGLAHTLDRDVLGIGMNWGVGERSSVGVGYQLHSTRPESSRTGGGQESNSILPGSDRVDHAVTFGVSRSWGGAD